MSVRKRRRLSRMMALGLAAAAVAAGSAQATGIPYLSQGQGISEEQLAQLQSKTPSAENQHAGSPLRGYVARRGYVAQDQVRSASKPSIAVGGRYLDSNFQAAINNRAASSAEVGGAAAMTAIVDLVEATGGDAGPLRADAGSPASASDDLSWGDFSMGAGSVLGLVLVAGAAMFTLRRSRKSQLAGT